MISLIEALNYRCLRHIRQPMDRFHILVGPNASGKTTFLDVVGFLSDLLTQGLDRAITNRTTDLRDLLYRNSGYRFELAIELSVPDSLQAGFPSDSTPTTVRYEVAVGLDQTSNEHHIFDEQVLLHNNPTTAVSTLMAPETIMHSRLKAGWQRVLRKSHQGNDNYHVETLPRKGRGAWSPSFRLGPRKSALANMPEDDGQFPVSTWLRQTLVGRTERLILNSLALRQSSRPGQGRGFVADGSNLPFVVAALKDTSPGRFRKWIAHLQLALPDLTDIDTIEIPENRHRYLQLIYSNGQIKVPSWTASDGTLRLMALTLLAYLPSLDGIYLIEEPENGIHPRAIETVYQSISSVWDAQILLATHSPVILSCAEPRSILCFRKNIEGATEILRGSDHTELKKWQASMSLGDMLASGVLG